MFGRTISKKESDIVIDGLLPIVQDRLENEVFAKSAGAFSNRSDLKFLNGE